jgi:23S rRNA (adenine1618-N6)-methyltransferase
VWGVRELTRALLAHDFGIEWWLPDGHLVPPVTNRANYINWLEDLLGLSAPQGESLAHQQV